MTKQRSKSRLRRWTEWLLLASGLILLGIWGGAKLTSVLWQDWQNRSFDRQVRNREEPAARSPNAKAPAPKRGDVLGRISIRRLELSSMVREGDDEATLSLAVGHVPGTPLPGQRGNVAVAGHRDTIFRALRLIKKNDVISFETLSGNHEYQVDSIKIVKPTDIEVLRSGPTSQLTLVTCYPFYYVGSAPKRFIVSAHELPSTVTQAEVRTVSTTLPMRELPGDRSDPSQASNAKVRAVRDSRPEASETSVSVDPPPGMRGVSFDITKGHGSEVAPGISLGISGEHNGRADGWMWVMPDRRSVLFKNQAAGKPLIFYQDGEKRELILTTLSSDHVSGSVFVGAVE